MMSMPRLAEPTTRTGATRPRTYSPYYLSFYLVFSVVKHTYLSLSFSRLSRLVVSLSITQSNTQASNPSFNQEVSARLYIGFVKIVVVLATTQSTLTL